MHVIDCHTDKTMGQLCTHTVGHAVNFHLQCTSLQCRVALGLLRFCSTYLGGGGSLGGLPLAGHTRLSRVNSTAGGLRQSRNKFTNGLAYLPTCSSINCTSLRSREDSSRRTSRRMCSASVRACTMQHTGCTNLHTKATLQLYFCILILYTFIHCRLLALPHTLALS